MWKLYITGDAYVANTTRIPFYTLVDPLGKYYCSWRGLGGLESALTNFESLARPRESQHPSKIVDTFVLIAEAKSRISLLNDFPEIYL